MIKLRFVPALVLLALFWIPRLAFAEEQPPEDKAARIQKKIDALRKQMQEQQKAYEAQLDELQKELNELSTSPTAVTTKTAPPTPTAPASAPEETGGELEAALAGLQASQPLGPQPPSLGAVGRTFQSMNPDISIIGDFLAHYDSRGDKADFGNEFLLREIELAFSSYIDPYARADIFVSISEDPHTKEFGIDVEEAYLTLVTLPWDLQAKVGRFKADFGKANTMHLHALPWVEEPLVIRRFFGEEGLSGDGVSVNWLVPNPWNHYIEVTAEIFNNDNQIMFGGSAGHDFTELLHARDVLTLSPASTLEVGLSGATGPNDSGHGSNRSWVEGLDLTYKWRPTQEGLYRSLLFQNELFFAQKDTPGGQEDSWGAYSALEYQLSRRWYAGTRYDFSELPDDSSMREHAGSLYLTFRQSEFCYWRLGYQHCFRNFEEFDSKDDDQLWLQLNYSLGVHGAHKY